MHPRLARIKGLLRKIYRSIHGVSSCDEAAADEFNRSKCLLLRLCDKRQRDANRCSLARFALGFDSTAVELGEMLHYRQSESRSTGLVAARFVPTIKS